METGARIALLVIPSAEEGTNDVHFLLDRKTVILSLAEIPSEQLSRIAQAVYIRPGSETEPGKD